MSPVKVEPIVGAVVLMAGRSSRMEVGNKLLMPLEAGISVAEQTLQSVVQAGYSPIVVVTGHDDDLLRERLKQFDVHWVYNAQYQDGMGTSIAKGIAAIEGQNWDGALIALGDMPFVSVQTLSVLRTEFKNASSQIIAPICNERRGQPVVFPAHFFDDLRQCSGDVGGKWIVKANPESVRTVTVDDEGIHWDVDTTELFHHYRTRYNESSPAQ